MKQQKDRVFSVAGIKCQWSLEQIKVDSKHIGKQKKSSKNQMLNTQCVYNTHVHHW